ncbi:MAG TPA: TIM barrel protein, partial [Terriglobales bacterium]|nr:TIM barrel protein [Terriglobales bacterium]
MKRREFFQAGAGTLAALAAAKGVLAQGRFGGGAPAAPVVPGPLRVDIYSRHLQWLRTPDEVAEAAIEMAYDGVDITVRPYPGHVDPARVKTDLPPFVNTIRKHGLQVITITCPITDADSPHAEEILATASSLGIHHYWWGTFRYQQNQPVQAQLDALKPRVAKLAALNAKYGMTAMYHTYSGAGMVGASIWDMLNVLREFDPKQVGFHYDIGHMTVAGGGGTWVTSLREAGPYVAGISCKDYVLEPTLKVDEGGPMSAAVEKSLNQPFQFGGGARGGRGGGAGAGRAAGRGGAAGLGRAAAPGRGAGPGRGGFTMVGMKPSWRERAVPLNTGMVDLPTLATILKE